MEFRVDVKIWKQKNDLWVEVVLYIYVTILSLIFCMIAVWENSTCIMIFFPMFI